MKAHPPSIAARGLTAAALWLACWSGPAGAGAPAPSLLQRLFARADDAVAARCLTPASGEALQRAVAAGALQQALGDAFRLENGRVLPQHIDIEIRGDNGTIHVVRVAIPGSEPGTAHATGDVFEFFLRDPAGDETARRALLAVAAAVDAAIPAATLERCAGSGAPHADRRYPRAVALAGAASQLLVILAAIAYALRVLPDPPSRRRG